MPPRLGVRDAMRDVNTEPGAPTARLWNKVVAWTITAALVLIVLYLLLTTVTS
jgi:hypothetical protein